MTQKQQTFSQDVISEAMSIVRPAMTEVRTAMRQNAGDALFGKFRQQYDTLDVETILRVKQALGHNDSEEDPCKVCQFIAKKEVELQDEVTNA